MSHVDEDALETAFVLAYERTHDIRAANRVVIRVYNLLSEGGPLAPARAELAIRSARPTLKHAELDPVIAEVAVAHGLAITGLTGASRTAFVCAARDEAAWRLRGEGHTYRLIGAALGGRTHTAVMLACRRHEARKILKAEGAVHGVCEENGRRQPAGGGWGPDAAPSAVPSVEPVQLGGEVSASPAKLSREAA